MAQVEGIAENKTLVKKSLDRNIGTITLDNPSKHNALSAALIGDLLMALFRSDRRRSASDYIAGAQGGEGLVGWARCPGHV